jgi:hypothetical protein
MKKIIVEPFHFGVTVFNNQQECIDWVISNHADYEIVEVIKSSKGLFHQFKNDPKFMLYYQDIDTLEHEIIHATWFLLDYASIPLFADNHEIQAYLFEHIKRLIIT